MITENDIRIALKKALIEINIDDLSNLQIHLNPKDRYSYLDHRLILRTTPVKYTYDQYPLIANEHVPIGEVHVGIFYRK